MAEIEAALAVVVEAGRTVLVRRCNRPDAGRWGFPGGKLEPGETVEAAALRELNEETSLRAAARLRLGRLRFTAGGASYGLSAVLCTGAAGQLRAGDDAEEAAWFPLSRVIAGGLIASRDVDRLALRAAWRARTLAGSPDASGRPEATTSAGIGGLRPRDRSL